MLGFFVKCSIKRWDIFGQGRPMKDEFCRDFVGGGGRHDRAACRDMKQTCQEVARARQERERPLFQL